jgi:hypothetical protein
MSEWIFIIAALWLIAGIGTARYARDLLGSPIGPQHRKWWRRIYAVAVVSGPFGPWLLPIVSSGWLYGIVGDC